MTTSAASLSLRHDTEVISLVGFAHGVSHFSQLLIPPLFPWLMRDFSLNFTAAGMLMTVYFVVSGIGQALAGFLVDRIGARPVLLYGLALICVAALLLAAAQNLPMLMLAAGVAGAGNAVFHPADFTLLNRQVTVPRLGHAFSVHGLSGTLGWAAAPVFMFGIATATSWRVASLAAAGVALVSLAAVFVKRHALDPATHVASASDSRSDSAAPSSTTFGFLRSRQVWMCFAFFLSLTLAFSALQNFAPAVLGYVYGLSLALATSAVTAYMLGSAVGTITGGFLASSTTPDRAVAWALSAGAVVALVLATGRVPAESVIPLIAVMGFGTGLAGPSRDLLVRKAAVAGVGSASYGRIYGFVYSGLDTGLAVAPLVFGGLMDAARFQHVLVGVAIFQGMAILTALRVGNRAAAVA